MLALQNIGILIDTIAVNTSKNNVQYLSKGVIHMLQIHPVSELRNYNKVLDKVKKDSPVFLTKNGYGKFALVDIEEYDEFTAALELVNKLKRAEKSKHYNFDDIKGDLFS